MDTAVVIEEHPVRWRRVRTEGILRRCGVQYGRLQNAGTESVGSTPQELDAFNRDQVALYRGIVQDPRLKLNLQ